MRRSCSLVLLAGLSVLSAACKKEEPAPKGAAAAPGKAAGTDGGGDGSGSSIANAKALTRTAPTTFRVPCSGNVYVGPFDFKKDPEKLEIRASSKGTTAEQVCVGGNFVDSGGKFQGVAGIGCAEGGKPTESTLAFEYSPGNGGNGTRPVYLAIGFEPALPAGCATSDVTLTLR